MAIPVCLELRPRASRWRRASRCPSTPCRTWSASPSVCSSFVYFWNSLTSSLSHPGGDFGVKWRTLSIIYIFLGIVESVQIVRMTWKKVLESLSLMRTVRACLCACVRVCMGVCVCLCVCERERRHRQTDTHTRFHPCVPPPPRRGGATVSTGNLSLGSHQWLLLVAQLRNQFWRQLG